MIDFFTVPRSKNNGEQKTIPIEKHINFLQSLPSNF